MAGALVLCMLGGRWQVPLVLCKLGGRCLWFCVGWVASASGSAYTLSPAAMVHLLST